MQHLIADTLDDLLYTVFKKILRNGQHVSASKGRNKELSGVILELRNLLARLSRTETKGTVFSCLGETLWYLAGSNELEFIKYYISQYGKFAEPDGTVHGAYGPRLFDMRSKINQIDSVIKLLRRKQSSRQAVIQLFNAEDLLQEYNDIPCTCTMQFLVRKSCLHSVVHMRSNDAFLGLPHDIFAFTFIQELIARSLNLRLGTYKHMVGSLHIYNADKTKIDRFFKEGYQSSVIRMPRMPIGDPWSNLKKLIDVESRIRQGNQVQVDRYKVPPYWADLMRLLQVFALKKSRKSTRLIRSKMTSPVYDPYINKNAK
jgi:thymidylate synthase